MHQQLALFADTEVPANATAWRLHTFDDGTAELADDQPQQDGPDLFHQDGGEAA